MAGVNKVILVGNLGKDPELKYLEGNIARANFSIATSEYHKDKNGNKVEQTEWHNIVLWRGLAEAAEKLQLHKGHMVFIEGKLRTRHWEKDGIKRYATEIIAENMTMLSKRDAQTPNTTSDDQNQHEIPPMNDLGGDLPF